MKKFTFIDLFSGIGGFRLALDKFDGECINFSEISKDAINTYCKNFDDKENNNLGDITQIKELPKCNILTAGVPCQSWSIAGRNLGFDDDRGQLWNDTIYLLNQARPDCFIFENVKGLTDPRNSKAFNYILERIKDAGYFAKPFILNSYNYGVPQNRIRVYIIGFKEKHFLENLNIPDTVSTKHTLADIIKVKLKGNSKKHIFTNEVEKKSMSISSQNGFNDYFLFNDLRNGHSTIHSWDLINTSERQKEICLFLLRNRRKSEFGILDGNPLALHHFKKLDETISKSELEDLVKLEILKRVEYQFEISKIKNQVLTENEVTMLAEVIEDQFNIDELKVNRIFKLKKISISSVINSLKKKGIIKCIEIRYDFKNTKISTGLFGINRIFMPSSNLYSTLVASDTNDFITDVQIQATDYTEFKEMFLNEVYNTKRFRKISKEEACMIQGFPPNFILPDNRARWMKLIGNSVSVSVIEMLIKSIIDTGVFENQTSLNQTEPSSIAKKEALI